MENYISILCPTRERCEKAICFANSVINTTSKKDRLEILFYVDLDDSELSKYQKNLAPIDNCHIIVGKPMSISKSWNIIAAKSKGDILIMGNDDLVYRTQGWDVILDSKVDLFPDKVFCMWFDDGGNGVNHCAFPMVSREWYNAVGYFTPGVFEYTFNDTWIMDLGKKTGRLYYINEVVAEHLHPGFKKAKPDSTFLKNFKSGKGSRDEVKYGQTVRKRNEDANKLRNIMKLTVGFVGLGKLGLPCALAMEKYGGYDILGFDVSEEVQKSILERKIRYKEVKAQDLLNESNIKLVSLEGIVEHSDVIFMAIQTPHDPQFEGITRIPQERADFCYDYLKKGVSEIAKIAEDKNRFIDLVIISTVLPGTIEREIKPLLNKFVNLCYNPFFIAMGTTIDDFMNPEFVLLGADDIDLSNRMVKFYSKLHNKSLFCTTISAAELIKVTYNTFIGMKIAFANTVMEICHKKDINCDDVTNALSLATDRLISPKYMKGGMGDGGGCHPRDNIAMSWLAKELNLSYNIFDDIMKARENQTEWLAQIIKEQAHQTKLPVIVCGLSFKPETNLTVGSPSILLLNMLKELGITAERYDPFVLPNKEFPNKTAIYFIGTNHSCFSKLSFPKNSVVIDPWGIIKLEYQQFWSASQKEFKLIDIGRNGKL